MHSTMESNAAWFGDPQGVLSVLQDERRERGWTPQLPEFDIQHELGRGGQGIVFLALQRSTQKPVALKVLLDGHYASSTRRRRFERELEIVATLHHPNIVQVFGGGLTRDGRPYLVMEYVSGAPLDQWLAQRPGPPSNRTDLATVAGIFAGICDAVNHAHLRGVIHRDLKPGNVLIDQEARPHVLDFGLARTDSGATQLTQSGQFFGSLPWTSPEQVRGDHSAVDLRSDVYSLGVLLYQALTDTAPYDVSGGMQQATHNIAFVEPPRPRVTNPVIDSDLQAIILRALEKAPTRRYQSAGAMAADLRAWLKGGPVEARSDSGWYLIRKAVRRFRLPIGIGAGFLALTLVYAGTLSVLYRENAQARARAEAALTRADKINGFLGDILATVNPNESGYRVTVAEVLDGAETEAQRRFANEPEVNATIAFKMSRSFLSLGNYQRSKSAAQRAYELRRQILGERHPDTLDALEMLVESSQSVNPNDPAVHAWAEKCLELAQQEDPRGPRTLRARIMLFAIKFSPANLDEMEHQIREMDALAQRVSPDSFAANCIRVNFIMTLRRRGLLGEAEHYARELIDRLNRGPDPESQFLLAQKLELGRILIDSGRVAEADPLIRSAYEVICRILGPLHPAALIDSEYYVRLLLARGECQAAREFASRQYQEVVAGYPDDAIRIQRAQLLVDFATEELGEPLFHDQP